MGPQTFAFRSLSCRAALLLVLLAVLSIPLLAQAPPAAAAPQAAVVFNLRSTDLQVVDHKYRVFFNKFEKKSLPIQGYDLQGALRDEVMNTLAEDKRFQWRVAAEADKLDAAKLADEKQRTPEMLAGSQAERVLLVDMDGFGAFISGLAKDRLEIMGRFTMLDRATGKKIWNQKIWEKVPFSGDLQKLQGENQKELREGINALIEKACQKLKSKLAEKG